MQNRNLRPEVIMQDAAPTPRVYAIEPVASSIQRFPTTRYYGSKKKLLPWIYESMKLLEFHSVLDAFGGTGSVSQLFRAMKKEVSYHDAFRFNCDVASTVLTESSTLNLERLEKIIKAVRPMRGTVSKYFENVFFLPQEDEWIDGFATLLSSIDASDADRSLLRYLLYQACLKKRPFNLFHRSNLGIRTNKSVNRSFGNLATWEKSFHEHMIQSLKELLAYRRDRLPSAQILPPGDVSSLGSGYDLVYLDPPYVSESESRNRDNYWLRYHFLEGLSNYAEWPVLIDQRSSIRMIPEPDHFTEWSRRKSFKEKLFDLIDVHKRSTVVLSYVKAAYPDDVAIREFFESRFSRVTVHSTEHSHALSGSKKRELLFIGVPS
ncbi:DNA adenine methylase [Rhizobium redzepovicii]